MSRQVEWTPKVGDRLLATISSFARMFGVTEVEIMEVSDADLSNTAYVKLKFDSGFTAWVENSQIDICAMLAPMPDTDALRAENERLRAALREIAELPGVDQDAAGIIAAKALEEKGYHA